MKTSKCLMGVLLSAVVLFGSAFAGNALSQDVKDGLINKGQISVYNETRNIGEHNGNTDRDCTDCEFDFTAYGSECCDSAWDEYGINCADLEANYNWDCSGCLCPGDQEGECGDGTCNINEDCESCEADCGVCGECDAGYIVDCDGSNECWPESWIGDGFADCQDQAYGADLTCYDCDGGDCPESDPGCGGTAECGDGYCNGDETEASCPEDCASSGSCSDCEFDFTAYGSECCDTAWDEYGINCADLEANYSWDCSGCNCPGDGDPECGDGVCNGDETYETCPDDCNAPGECDAGYVTDCVDDDCCPESWIGDGFEDCEDQAYGCDLTCYDNDGGDCPDCENSCGDGACNCGETYDDCPSDCNAPGECDDGYITDCVDDDCCPESWIGDGFEDCEDQAFGCDLTCYDNDGGDCPEACENETCWDGSCVDDLADCPDEPEVPDATGVCIAGSELYGYAAITMSWDITTECGDGTCNGDEDYYNCPDDCNAPGECDDGYVPDCVDDDCCPESWIGDGFEDCEDQAYGCDLTCYDNDGGDCGGGGGGGSEDCDDCEFDFTAYGSECCDTAWDEYGINCADLEANYSWDCSGCNCPGDGDPECGDGVCNGSETYETCPEDCNEPGECDAGFVPDCADDDCCPESWIGDGFEDCEDQAYGCDLTCYDSDGGDCADPFCGDGACNGGETEADCPEDCMSSETCGDCEFDFTAYGSECCDTAWDEYGIDCATLESNYSWDCSGCNCPGDIPCEDQGLIECEFGAIEGGNCAEDESGCLEEGSCPDGQVADCDGSGECWPESWIGDGFEDCEDQQYGADLTCYDNDGGDCGETVSCEEQGLIECMDGSCAETADDCAACPDGTVADCSGDGDCCFETWIGDGYGDCEDQAFGCDLTCYDNDGGDCDGRETIGGVKKARELITHVSAKKFVVNEVQPIIKDGVVIHQTSEAVRVGQEHNSSTRALTATVALSCDACLYGGPWEGSWVTDAMAFGEFTVYGFDAGAVVCGTVTFCEDTNGACSDASDEVCAVAGDADSSECAEDDGCDGAGSGDVNGDGNADVLDIVQIVNVILGGSFADECAAAAADMNGDGSTDVLDIVQIVNLILGRTDVGDATTGKLIRDNGVLMLEANGYIGGVQMTLSHDADFAIELTDDALIADFKTVGNETKLVIVVPESEELFTYTGDFEIVDMIVANSEGRVNVGVPTEFSLSAAYPNPFNPTTSLELSVPANGQVTVQVYNLMGQVVATLANGYMDASTYTLTWDASNVSSGMYIVKAEAAGTVSIQKLMLMK